MLAVCFDACALSRLRRAARALTRSARGRSRAACTSIGLAACVVGCAARTMAPADAGPAPECETPVLEASCRFDGHGTECEVPCELPPDCSYRVTVEWLGSYCACDLVRNVFTDCRCTEGRSLCLVPGGRWRDVPTNPCEGGCPDAGAATDGGTGPLDAGLDASSDDDAGAADASSEAWTDASS